MRLWPSMPEAISKGFEEFKRSVGEVDEFGKMEGS
jgi:hypothetical protein